jgi:3-hydroxybutyryl-CoA dehydrogenase
MSGAARIHRVAVIGAGTMGHGIAQVAAQAGARVALVDADADRLRQGLERIRANLDDGVGRGKVSPELRSATLERVRGEPAIADAVGDADLVIEAVPEIFGIKVEVLRTAATHSPAHALLATNTSGLSVTALQAEVGHADRVLGMHFFNPVHILKLVEVVRGRDTAESAVATAVAFAERLGKEPIVVNDSPGFASSRLGVALGLEAMRMLEEGVASAAAIDRAMELGYRHPMGPLRLSDLVGLDVRLAIARHLHETLGAAHFQPPAILERLVAEGRLGRKTGEGFYRWTDEEAS